MIRCVDPELPVLIQGLVREHEDELADQRVLARFPAAGAMLRAFNRLIDQGKATLVEALEGEPVAVPTLANQPGVEGPIVIRSPAQAPPARLEIDLHLPDSRLLALYASTDPGELHQLLVRQRLEAGVHRGVARWSVEPAEGRITFWMISWPPDTAASGDGGPPLHELLSSPTTYGASVEAARYRPPS
jgi:hypothetical protein